MKLGVRSKLFFVSLGLIAAVVVIADLYLTPALDRLLTDRIREDLLIRSEMIARDAATAETSLADRTTWDALADEVGKTSQARVTLIRRDGVVLGDSELDLRALEHLENHGDRQEIIEALSLGRGASVRYSTTLRQRMMYVALPFQRAGAVMGVVRLAMPLTQVARAISGLRRSLLIASVLALFMAILMSSVAAHLTSRTLRRLTESARKMAKGDLTSRVRLSGRDEISVLGEAFDQLAESLSRSLTELRSEKDLLSRILAGMQEGVLVLGPDGRVVLVNSALREMLFLGSDVLGKFLLEVLRNAELKELLERARASSANASFSGEIELAGIKPRCLLVHAATLVGEPGGILAVFVDVTGTRRLESLRKDFVANVSHELRTPITAARSAAETLRSALHDPGAALRFVEIIDRNVERLQQLVEDILDLSRIESREFRLKIEPVEFAPLVKHIVSIYRDRTEEKHLQLSVEVLPETATARMDRRAMEQALGNLIDNAIKYCPEGSMIFVRVFSDGESLHVSVEDNGQGIEPRHLPRLFERFYRVDAGRSRELGGTGLGLAIVKHLIEAMGGTVNVVSTLGKGTTFTLTLPCIAHPNKSSSNASIE